MTLDLSSDFGRKVADRLQSEAVVWLTTTSADGTPQPNPVWFLFHDGAFLVFSQPHQAKIANIARNPHVSLNLNSTPQGDDVAVIAGSAVSDPAGPTDAEWAAYTAKYGEGIASIGLTPEGMLATYSNLIRITPEKLRGF
jgi:PPOX class probable F420-dependent enzyme